jgi:hypothetical protein
MKNTQGFVLSEILIFGSVTALLAIIAAYILIDARQQSRDSVRVSDVSLIRNALELYFHDCSRYPKDVIAGGQISSVQDCGGNVYLRNVPVDPKIGQYVYIPCGNNKCEPGITQADSYRLIYSLERGVGGIPRGQQMATPEKTY